MSDAEFERDEEAESTGDGDLGSGTESAPDRTSGRACRSRVESADGEAPADGEADDLAGASAAADGAHDDALVGSEALAVLFERTPVPVLALSDLDGPEVVAANAAFRRTFPADAERLASAPSGLSDVERRVVRELREDTEGSPDGPQPVRTALDPSVPPQEAGAGVGSGRTTGRASVTRVTPAGARTFEVTAVPGDGTEVAAFLCYRDVTEAEIREQQRRVLCRVLRHNVRNTLTVVQGWAEEVASRAECPAVREAAETILAEVRELGRFPDAAARLASARDESTAVGLERSLAEARREAARAVEADVAVDGPSEPVRVDSRLASGLTELCRLFAREAGAGAVRLDATLRDEVVVLRVRGDAALDAGQVAALRGEPETPLRHDTGVAAWVARWTLRRVGARIGVDRGDDAATTVTVTVPALS